MAERIVVACVQQRMHLPLTLDEYREDLRRFMRVAVNKQARLVIFPELGGVMVAPPILRDFRSLLLKRYDRGRRRHASLWQRMAGGRTQQEGWQIWGKKMTEKGECTCMCPRSP